MELTLKREPSTAISTHGLLYIDGVEFCHTLEDPVREKKIPRVTAIPAGRYRVEIAASPKRGIPVPWIRDVPGFEAIQIHYGNRSEDTSGCVLVGFLRGTDSIYRSRDAFHALMRQLKKAEGIWLTIMA